MEFISIIYRFKILDSSDEVFNLTIHPVHISLIANIPKNLPSWTHLEFNQCPNCILPSKKYKYCPLASHLVGIVSRFNRLLSFDEIQVEISTKNRLIAKKTSVQRALQSMMGLIIAASDCPHTVFLKPMARFHLPFSDEVETLYRATSMYLLAQYFIKKENGSPDFELNDLMDLYNQLHIVNTSIADRLRLASKTDSTVNAIVLLDIFTKVLPKAIDESLKEIQYLFKSFIKNRKP